MNDLDHSPATGQLFAQKFPRAQEVNRMLKQVAHARGMKAGRLAEQILLAALTKEIAKLESAK